MCTSTTLRPSPTYTARRCATSRRSPSKGTRLTTGLSGAPGGLCGYGSSPDVSVRGGWRVPARASHAQASPALCAHYASAGSASPASHSSRSGLRRRSAAVRLLVSCSAVAAPERTISAQGRAATATVLPPQRGRCEAPSAGVSSRPPPGLLGPDGLGVEQPVLDVETVPGHGRVQDAAPCFDLRSGVRGLEVRPLPSAVGPRPSLPPDSVPRDLHGWARVAIAVTPCWPSGRRDGVPGAHVWLTCSRRFARLCRSCASR